MRVRARVALPIFLGGVGACSVFAGLDEYEIAGDCENGACGDGSSANVDGLVDGGSTDASIDPRNDGDPGPDGTTTTDGGLPSFCFGVSLYLPFDGTMMSAQGDAPVQSMAQHFDAGKFGAAFEFQGLGTVHYQAVPDSGPPRLLPDAGTMALWFRGTWAFPGTGQRQFARARDTLAIGLLDSTVIRLDPGGVFGISNGSQVDACAPTNSLKPFWNDVGWNHIIGTWSTTSSPTMTFTLTSNTPAGVARVDTTVPWVPTKAVNFLRLSSELYGLDGLMDDLVIWSRPLSSSEITDLHNRGVAGSSFGKVCGL